MGEIFLRADESRSLRETVTEMFGRQVVRTVAPMRTLIHKTGKSDAWRKVLASCTQPEGLATCLPRALGLTDSMPARPCVPHALPPHCIPISFVHNAAAPSRNLPSTHPLFHPRPTTFSTLGSRTGVTISRRR